MQPMIARFNQLEARNTFLLQKWNLFRVLAYRKLNTAKPLVTPSSFVFFKLHSACLRLLLSSISSVFSLLKASSLSSSFEFSPHLYKKIVSRVTVVVESCWPTHPFATTARKTGIAPLPQISSLSHFRDCSGQLKNRFKSHTLNASVSYQVDFFQMKMSVRLVDIYKLRYLG